MKTITLIWANGGEEVVTCEYWRVDNGILRIQITRDEWRYVPLAALREWRTS